MHYFIIMLANYAFFSVLDEIHGSNDGTDHQTAFSEPSLSVCIPHLEEYAKCSALESRGRSLCPSPSISL